MSEEQKELVQEEEKTEEVDSQEEVQKENEEAAASEKKAKKKSSKKSGTAKLKEQIKDLEAKNEDLRDKYLRLFADFDNFKKRTAKEKLELISGAGKDVLLDILPVLDDFERGMKSVENSNNVDAVKEGSQLIFHKLKTMLEQKGIKEMESIGKDFDPEFHEGIAEVPAPTEDQKGKVIDEIEKGYYLNDKIIRYAKVVVGK